jgi:hypothetical protein
MKIELTRDEVGALQTAIDDRVGTLHDRGTHAQIPLARDEVHALLEAVEAQKRLCWGGADDILCLEELEELDTIHVKLTRALKGLLETRETDRELEELYEIDSKLRRALDKDKQEECTRKLAACDATDNAPDFDMARRLKEHDEKHAEPPRPIRVHWIDCSCPTCNPPS